jgi:MFS family permease
MKRESIENTTFPNRWRLPRNVIALGLVSLFNDASSEIIYPLLPLFLTGTLGASKSFVGLVEGISESASSLLKLPAGWLSDRVGKRKLLVVFGYGLASIVRPLLAITSAAWQVLGLRFIDRIGKGLRSAPRDALIADSTPAESRGLAFGFHRAMDHMGAIFGALISAWLIELFAGDYARVFWVAAIPALISFLILILAVRDKRGGESRPHSINSGDLGDSGKRTSELKEFSTLDTNFKRYLAILFLFTLGNSSDAFLLLRARECGVSIVTIPILWAALHVSKSFSSVVGGGLSDRYGRKHLIVGGWIVYAVIYLAFAFANRQSHIWVLFLVYGVYFGLTEGVEKAFVADIVKSEARGTAFGFYNLAIGIGAMPASLVTGILWQRFSAATALATGAGLSLLASILLTFAVSEKKF